jgi:hypothetical protein
LRTQTNEIKRYRRHFIDLLRCFLHVQPFAQLLDDVKGASSSSSKQQQQQAAASSSSSSKQQQAAAARTAQASSSDLSSNKLRMKHERPEVWNCISVLISAQSLQGVHELYWY